MAERRHPQAQHAVQDHLEGLRSLRSNRRQSVYERLDTTPQKMARESSDVHATPSGYFSGGADFQFDDDDTDTDTSVFFNTAETFSQSHPPQAQSHSPRARAPRAHSPSPSRSSLSSIGPLIGVILFILAVVAVAGFVFTDTGRKVLPAFLKRGDPHLVVPIKLPSDGEFDVNFFVEQLNKLRVDLENVRSNQVADKNDIKSLVTQIETLRNDVSRISIKEPIIDSQARADLKDLDSRLSSLKAALSDQQPIGDQLEQLEKSLRESLRESLPSPEEIEQFRQTSSLGGQLEQMEKSLRESLPSPEEFEQFRQTHARAVELQQRQERFEKATEKELEIVHKLASDTADQLIARIESLTESFDKKLSEVAQRVSDSPVVAPPSPPSDSPPSPSLDPSKLDELSQEFDGKLSNVNSEVSNVASQVSELNAKTAEMKSDFQLSVAQTQSTLKASFEARGQELKNELSDMMEVLAAMKRDLEDRELWRPAVSDIALRLQLLEERLKSLAVSEDAAIQLDMQSIMDLIDKDRTGEIDHAFIGGGAAVLSIEKPYQELLGFLWRQDWRELISPIQGPGSCFAVQGQTATVTIRLRTYVRPTEFIYQHVSPSINPNPKSAPRKFEVWGSTFWSKKWFGDFTKREKLHEGVLEFDPDGANLQRFPISLPENSEFKGIDVIQFRLLSNNGLNDYTCLYRLRVHGEEVPHVIANPFLAEKAKKANATGSESVSEESLEKDVPVRQADSLKSDL